MNGKIKPRKLLQSINIGLLILLGAVMLFSNVSWAQSSKYTRKSTAPKKGTQKKSSNTKQGSPDKLDISGLEQKYWAPKDTDFSVVQNRTYSKSKKYVVSLMYGLPINDPYNSGSSISLTGNYYFNERHGVQVSYDNYSLSDGDLITSFLGIPGNTTQVKPDYGRINNEIKVGYTWVPIYAKVSLLGKKIIYLDIAVTPHLGMVTYDQLYRTGSAPNYYTTTSSQSSVSFGFDITQYYFFSKNLAVRADLKNSFFNEKVLNYVDGTDKRERTTNATLFTVGVSYYFSFKGF